MKTAVVIISLAAFLAFSSAKEMPVDQALKERLYDSGVRHAETMALKKRTWDELDKRGVYDSTQYKSFEENIDFIPCKNGIASYVPGDPKYTFRCKELDLYDFKSHAELGSSLGKGAGSWGWTSPEGREFVAISQMDGAAFAEVSSKGKLAYLGRLPQYASANTSLWREIKGYQSYVIIGSEAKWHGIQIFDLKRLIDVDPASPVTFNNDEDIAGHWTDGLPLGRSHNVVVNEESGYGIAVGFHPRKGPLRAGLVFFDLTDPSNPRTLGGTGEDGYVHDAQCVVYRGPDMKYYGREVCYGFDEDTITIFDVTDKEHISIISSTSYEGFSFVHQGWVLDSNWQQFLISDDEYDEVLGTGLAADGYPISYIWDISSLESPKQTGHYRGLRKGIDHNQFVKNGFSYQSNYALGISILDLRSVAQDPTGQGIKEVAYFDIHPEDDHLDGGGDVIFTGTWSHYPFFPSGHIVINTMDRGAFVVKRSSKNGWP